MNQSNKYSDVDHASLNSSMRLNNANAIITKKLSNRSEDIEVLDLTRTK